MNVLHTERYLFADTLLGAAMVDEWERECARLSPRADRPRYLHIFADSPADHMSLWGR